LLSSLHNRTKGFLFLPYLDGSRNQIAEYHFDTFTNILRFN